MKAQTFFMILFLIILGIGVYEFTLEKNGINKEKSDFCENNNLVVRNEISFFMDMDCYKIENGMMKRYVVKEINDEY